MSIRTIWRSVKVREMKALQRLLWTNNSNCFCVMTVRSVKSKWEITWLQMKNQSKYPWIMTVALINFGKDGKYPKSIATLASFP